MTLKDSIIVFGVMVLICVAGLNTDKKVDALESQVTALQYRINALEMDQLQQTTIDYLSDPNSLIKEQTK